ncbi:MAG TPA: hypothetical protein VNR60_11715 [Croceibacterium sp.]|nr:hypothetical protein [Croceibacterium sp.]
MKNSFPVLALFALVGCAAAPLANPTPVTPDGIARAALGQKVYVDGPHVTPLEVLEDSRCPKGMQCVWAGRVKLSVRIDLGSRSETREIASDAPIEVADGRLSLVEIEPEKIAEKPGEPANYRFGFRFAGGI